MITKITPDMQKARALVNMAGITLERLEKTNISEYPSNTLVDYYDIIHKLLEAIALKEGTKAKGEGAHQELIDCISKHLKLNEQTRQFLQQLRDYRNRVLYEGFMIQKNFIVTNQLKIKAIIERFYEII